MSVLAGVRRGGIAVVGDEFFTLTLRLGGATKYFILSKELSSDELMKKVKEIISEVSKSNISLLIIQEDLRELFKGVDIPRNVLFMFIPSLQARDKFDIREYYLSLIRRYLGIHIEVG